MKLKIIADGQHQLTMIEGTDLDHKTFAERAEQILAANHALRVLTTLGAHISEHGGSVRIVWAQDKFHVAYVKRTAPGLEGPVGPLVSDKSLRGALANLLEAMRGDDANE